MEETKEIMEKEASELSLMNEESKDAEILYEDVSRRKENTKHFRMKNGNFMAVVYDEPVHKLNEKTGKLEEIKEEFTETEEEYEASTKHFKVKLPKKEGRRKFVTVDKDGKSVSFRFASGKPTHTKRPEAKMRSVKKHYWEHKKYPTVKYEKVDNITSLEYEVNDGGIKENIVLTKCPETSTFKFDMMCNGLTPKLSENKKRVILLDENEEAVMVIPPANMTDDNGVYSEDIHYELCETENGTTLEMVVENDWLSAYERKYPVTIDPRVDVISNFSTDVIKEICNDGTCVFSGETRTAGLDASGNIHRIYIKLSLPEIESTAKIVDAKLNFHIDTANTVNTGSTFNIYYVNSSVDISNLNWENQPVIDGTDIITTFNGNYTSNTVNIKDRVKLLYEDSKRSDNYIVIKHSQETPTVTYPVGTLCLPGDEEETPTPTPEPIITYDRISIYSNTAATVSNRPTVFIQYVPTDLYVTDRKHYTFECGAAGSGSIDLSTGSLTFTHNDGICNGFRCAPPISHIYKTEYMDKTESSDFGKGWNLSPIQELEVYNTDGYKARYTDSLGNIIYFVEHKDDEGNITVTDELGLGLEFLDTYVTLPEWVGAPRVYCIRDEHENRILFNEDKKFLGVLTNEDKGFIASIDSNTGLYNGICEEIVSNIDNRFATLEYHNSVKKLSALNEYISHNSGNELKLNGTTTMYYSSSGMLTSITRPDGKVTKFTYNNNRLTYIEDYMGIGCAFSYDGSGRVVSVIIQGNNIISNDKITDGYLKNSSVIDIEYRAKSTAIIDRMTKVKTVYVLDDYGRERYSYMDISEAVDEGKRTPTTLIQLKEYSPIDHPKGLYANGKYRSMTAIVDRDYTYQTNYITNNLFSNGITGWTLGQGIREDEEKLSSITYINNAAASGAGSYYFGDTVYATNRYISQTVSINPQYIDGDILVASAWAKSTGHISSFNQVGKFKMIVKVTYESEIEEYSEDFDIGCNSWQCVAIPIKLKRQADVMVKLDYSGNTGTCYFTNVRLVAADTVNVTKEYYANSYLEVRDMLNTSETTYIKIKYEETISDKNHTRTEYYDLNSDKVMEAIDGFYSFYKYDNHILTKSMNHYGIVDEYNYILKSDKSSSIEIKEYEQSNPSIYRYIKNDYDACGRISTARDQRPDFDEENSTAVFSPYEFYTYNSNGKIDEFKSKQNQIFKYTYDTKLKDKLKTISADYGESVKSNTMNYTNGFLTKVSSNGNEFEFTYDELGRIKSIKIGNSELLNKAYRGSAKTEITTTYANGEAIKVYNDIFGNPVQCVRGEFEFLFTADYLVNGSINYIVDKKEKIKYNYVYNSKGNVICVEHIDITTGDVKCRDAFEYYSDGRVLNKTYGAVLHKYIPTYETYSSNDLYPEYNVNSITLDGKYTESFSNDGLRRINYKTLTLSGAENSLFYENYSYLPTYDSNRETYVTTDYVESTNFNTTDSYDNVYSYEYDVAGNIIKYTSKRSTGNDFEIIYQYDKLGRIECEEDRINNKSYEWIYDNNGNIIEKRVFNILTSVLERTYEYTYSTEVWKDQLVSYDGRCCEYDALGNPTTYLSNDLVWEGRKLKSFNNHTFDYNSNGIRIKKNNTVYTLDGNRILKETDGTNTLVYYYGLDGIVGFSFNGADYYYRKNLMGDITEIYSSSGELAASYVYDAFGNILRISDHNNYTVANINPFRFKSYYFDKETGLYYLNSRYYDPETGRFISPDSLDYLDPETLGGINLYSYCNNNPVMYADPSGHFSWLSFAISIGFSLAFEVIEDAIYGGLGDGSHDWRDYLGAAVSGALGTFGEKAEEQIIFSIAGGIVDAVITGDFAEDGFFNTMISIAGSTLVSLIVGGVSKRIASKIKASSLKKMSNKLANKELKAMGLIIKMGSNAVKKGNALAPAIMDSGWIGSILSEALAGSIFGGSTSLAYGLLSNEYGWHF